MPRLHPDWRRILRRAWSVRLMALAFILTAAEVALPAVPPIPGVSPTALALAAGLVTAGAFVARLIAQKDFEDA